MFKIKLWEKWHTLISWFILLGSEDKRWHFPQILEISMATHELFFSWLILWSFGVYCCTDNISLGVKLISVYTVIFQKLKGTWINSRNLSWLWWDWLFIFIFLSFFLLYLGKKYGFWKFIVYLSSSSFFRYLILLGISVPPANRSRVISLVYMYSIL